MRALFLILSIFCFLAPAFADDSLIPYKALKRSELGSMKLSLDVEVPLINEKLPTKKELGSLSEYLVNKEEAHDKTFVLFYLPGMELGAGAYASAHHNPDMQVKIMKFNLLRYPEYQKFAQ